MRYERQTSSRISRSIRAAALIWLALLASHSAARDKPQLFEKEEHYYGAKSYGFGEGGVRWEVPRTTVTDGEPFAATLVIGSAQYPVLNPTDVRKPDLSKLSGFANSFSVTDAPDPPRKATDKDVRFRYKLTPRNRVVAQVPELNFRYFNPRAPGDNKFRHALAEAVSITVSDPPKRERELKPMTEAGNLFAVTTGPEVLRGPFVPCRWAWTAAALFGPLVAVGWFLAWRRIFPDAARMARSRRSRATRRAIDAIRRAGRTADPPATIAAAVLSYLRTRFTLPEIAVTPGEIGAALAEAEVPAEIAVYAADVFRACDRARFSPPDDNAVSLATDAESLVTRLEALA